MAGPEHPINCKFDCLFGVTRTVPHLTLSVATREAESERNPTGQLTVFEVVFEDGDPMPPKITPSTNPLQQIAMREGEP